MKVSGLLWSGNVISLIKVVNTQVLLYDHFCAISVCVLYFTRKGFFQSEKRYP